MPTSLFAATSTLLKSVSSDKIQNSQLPCPPDAEKLKAIPPVICYPGDQLQVAPPELYFRARKNFELVESLEVPPKEAQTFEIPAGHFFRIVCVDGPQVGDLNLWQAENLKERFYSTAVTPT